MSWADHKRAVQRYERRRHLREFMLAVLWGAAMGLLILAWLKGWF